ncbi:MAG: hypothetical protein ACOH1O_05790 [Flavobacterium sp.]
MKRNIRYIAAFILTAFALLTLYISSSLIFDLNGVRAEEGDYVLIVVWANFICSILYLFSAYGFVNAKKQTILYLGVAILVLLSAFILFGIHIYTGGIYMTKTIVAMIFRIVVTVIFGAVAYYTINKEQSK